MKNKQLQRELMMSGQGFVKQLSLSEMYKESLAWKQVERIGRHLTSNWPKDPNGEDYWDPTLYLSDIRYVCIKIMSCKTNDDLKELFKESLISPFLIKLGCPQLASLKLLLTWVALKFSKNPSNQARRYMRYLRNFSFGISPDPIQYFIDNNLQDKYTNIYNDLLTIEEELEVAYSYEWIYKNIELLSPQIENMKENGVYLIIKPELAKPKNIHGGWCKATNSFDLSRIGDILELWENSADKIIVAEDILDDYERSSIDSKEEKILFLKLLIQSLKKDRTINLLCSLKKENMEATGVISTLSAENKKLEYKNKSMEEEILSKEKALKQRGAIFYHKHCESEVINIENINAQNLYNVHNNGEVKF